MPERRPNPPQAAGAAEATEAVTAPGSDRAGRRAAAKEETRAALVRAARELFAGAGLHAPSLDEICARAGYTRGAFYVHFRSRQELVGAVVEDALQDFVGRVVRSEEPGDLGAVMRRYVDALFRLSAGDPTAAGRGLKFHQLVEICFRKEPVAARVLEVLDDTRTRLAAIAARGQESRALTDRVTPPELATLFLVLSLGVVAAKDMGVPIDYPSASASWLRLLARERA